MKARGLLAAPLVLSAASALADPSPTALRKAIERVVARPDLGFAAFEAMADVLVTAGVRSIEGRLIGHEGCLLGDRRGSDQSWEDLVWGYGAEVSALSFNDNVVDLSVRPGERPAGTDRVLLSGRVPLGGGWEGRVAVEAPARHAATVFAEVLEAKGILVTGGVDTSSSPLPAVLRILATHDGVTMAEIIRVVNKESEHLHAEMLLRLIGLRVKGEGSASPAPTSSLRGGWPPSSSRWAGTRTPPPSARPFRLQVIVNNHAGKSREAVAAIDDVAQALVAR